MCGASVHLYRLFAVTPSDIIDVAVTCDGTWSKHGFTATYGIVVVISWMTGQVLDFEILSKRCAVCSLKKEKLDESSEEFKEWYEEYKSECELNHVGSSPVMEPEGVVKIWKQLVEKLHMRCTTVISDGDSKKANNLNNVQPYGDQVKIVKHECVGHVQKRLSSRLRQLKKTRVVGVDGKVVKFGGKGRLTGCNRSAGTVLWQCNPWQHQLLEIKDRGMLGSVLPLLFK